MTLRGTRRERKGEREHPCARAMDGGNEPRQLQAETIAFHQSEPIWTQQHSITLTTRTELIPKAPRQTILQIISTVVS